ADSKTLVSGGEGGIVKIWDAATGKERATIVAESDNVRFLAIAPDGRTLGTVCHERGPHSVLKLWDLETRQLQRQLHGHAHMIEWITFTPDGKKFATVIWVSKVNLWDVGSVLELATLRGQ